MTVARGLFRLWVVFSALWVAGAGFQAWRTLPALVPVFPQPIFAPDAPTKPLPPDKAPFDPDAYLADKKWPGTPVNRNKPIIDPFEQEAHLESIAARENAISSAAQVALLPPAFFLIFGMGLIWAIRGFRP
jgi:hypothetical protein